VFNFTGFDSTNCVEIYVNGGERVDVACIPRSGGILAEQCMAVKSEAACRPNADTLLARRQARQFAFFVLPNVQPAPERRLEICMS
jgi:hypothetical protein